MKNRSLFWFVTCGPVGFLPVAPGSWASALACLCVYFLPSVFGHPLIVTLLAVASLAALARLTLPEKDPGFVVVDEVVGMLVTLLGHGGGVAAILKGFILFRAFDILKPYPIRKLERFPGGFGIMADDVAAGLLANGVLILLGRLI